MHKQLRVILLSPNPELNQLRAQVLQEAGYWTEHPTTTDEALTLIREITFHALIVCHTLEEQEAQASIREFRKANPKSPVIGIFNAEMRISQVPADFWIHHLQGPRALLQAVDSALQRAA